jgi:uncharacterized protein with NAD-binding domain and iron-sulfur cluster
MAEAGVDPKKVVVIGGGVAGLTAAHELQERGFKVVVYERNDQLGGKARSFRVPDKFPFLKSPLPKAIHNQPAEHGFRFFPGFYKHLTDTLSRIPCPEPGNEKRRVVDHLVKPQWAAYARRNMPFFRIPTDRPETADGWGSAIGTLLGNPPLRLSPFEVAFAVFKLASAMSMCIERRADELDGRTWWNYMRADEMSPSYQSIVVDGLTQNFVAMDSKMSSTKSVINILARLIDDFLRAGLPMDRILDGPTSEVWIDPWVRYLKVARRAQIPVAFKTGRAVHSLVFDGGSGRVAGIRLRREPHPGAPQVEIDDDSIGSRGGKPIETDASYFIAAVPVEAMQRMLYHSPPLVRENAPSLANLDSNLLQTNWMSGIMYYLKADVTMEDTGHLVFIDSPWALTAISQKQFWAAKDADAGKVRGILSVIISDWSKVSATIGKTARQTDTALELVTETFEQIRESLPRVVQSKLDWSKNIVGWYVDPALRYKRPTLRDQKGKPIALDENGNPAGCPSIMSPKEFARLKSVLMHQKLMFEREGDLVEDPTPEDYIEKNLEPLFINTVNSWRLRPHAKTGIGNFFLASDYVRNNTDLATMEGANESARRAVNELLNHFESESKQNGKLARCSIFEFDEPPVFAPLRAVDKYLFHHKLAGPSTFFGDALDYLAYFRRGVLNRVKPPRLLSKISEQLRMGFFLGI